MERGISSGKTGDAGSGWSLFRVHIHGKGVEFSLILINGPEWEA
jgi:hypothetical protein